MKASAVAIVLAALCLHAGGILAAPSQGCRSSAGLGWFEGAYTVHRVKAEHWPSLSVCGRGESVCRASFVKHGTARAAEYPGCLLLCLGSWHEDVD